MSNHYQLNLQMMQNNMFAEFFKAIRDTSTSEVKAFLYPYRRRVELFGALYALGFGAWLIGAIVANTPNPISWVTEGADGQIMIAECLLVVSFIHAVGIKINGLWRWSPALRMLGMIGHSVITALFCIMANGTSGTYTYGWLTMILLIGAWGAFQDLLDSLSGKWKWTSKT